jgi:hypothetical protein
MAELCFFKRDMDTITNEKKNLIVRASIQQQIKIDNDLRSVGIKDLVADYGELLAARALGDVKLEKPVTPGHDITHPELGKVQVKTRKLPVKANGKTGSETRAVFKVDEPNQFDWLLHIILNPDYSINAATRAKYDEVWPEITKTSMKVTFPISSTLSSSVNMTDEIKEASKELFKE